MRIAVEAIESEKKVWSLMWERDASPLFIAQPKFFDFA